MMVAMTNSNPAFPIPYPRNPPVSTNNTLKQKEILLLQPFFTLPCSTQTYGSNVIAFPNGKWYNKHHPPLLPYHTPIPNSLHSNPDLLVPTQQTDIDTLSKHIWSFTIFTQTNYPDKNHCNDGTNCFPLTKHPSLTTGEPQTLQIMGSSVTKWTHLSAHCSTRSTPS